ncbi:Membrane protein chaperone oxaA (fragment) [Latilactobacillus sakei]
MQTTVLMSPAITFFISLFAPAGLALYFLAGGMIMIIQQMITTFIIMPRVKKRIDQEIKEKPIVTVVTKDMFTKKAAAKATETPVTPETTHTNKATMPSETGKRNSGKQRHKPQA